MNAADRADGGGMNAGRANSISATASGEGRGGESGGVGVLLIGGGGHALVVSEAAQLAGMGVRGFLDDRPHPPLAIGAGWVAHVGKVSELETILEAGGTGGNTPAAYILAIGDLAMRRTLLNAKVLSRTSAVAHAATVIHPAAFVSPTATIGAGVYIGPQAVVHSRAAVGDHAIINSGAIVEHDCRIGENTHIAPGAVLGGGVEIGADTLVGLGSRVLPRVKIGVGGGGVVIGAGSVVLREVASGARMVGVPAREMGSR